MSFDLDVDSGLLNLTFSEAIRKDNVSLRFIVLTNGQPSVLEQYLEKSTAIGLDGPIVTIRLSRDDLNDLKKTSDLASTKDNTFLAILDGALIDTNGNAVKEILLANATAEDQYVADTTPPALESFDFVMDNNTLPLYFVLHFDETVDVGSLDVTKITLKPIQWP